MHSSYDYPKQLILEYKSKIKMTLTRELPTDVECFLDFIIEHLYDGSTTLEDAFSSCKINKSGFTTRFSFYTGKNPKRFVLEHRINAAKLLIEEYELTLAHVCIMVGFTTHSAFSKAFKSQNNGISPSNWKKS